MEQATIEGDRKKELLCKEADTRFTERAKAVRAEHAVKRASVEAEGEKNQIAASEEAGRVQQAATDWFKQAQELLKRQISEFQAATDAHISSVRAARSDNLARIAHECTVEEAAAVAKARVRHIHIADSFMSSIVVLLL